MKYTNIKRDRYTIKIREHSADTFYAMVIRNQSNALDDEQNVLLLRSYKSRRSAEQACTRFVNKQLKGI